MSRLLTMRDAAEQFGFDDVRAFRRVVKRWDAALLAAGEPAALVRVSGKRQGHYLVNVAALHRFKGESPRTLDDDVAAIRKHLETLVESVAVLRARVESQRDT